MNTQTNCSVRSCMEIKDALRYVKRISERKKLSDDEWYVLDRNNASEYLRGFPEWQKKIDAYFSNLKEQGESTIFVDVCGRALGESLGASKSYSFSLQPPNPFFATEIKDTCFQGDIFSSKDFGTFVNLLRKKGDRPAFVIFEPYAGLESYVPPSKKEEKSRLRSEVTYQLLINNLRKMIGVLRGGGFIMIGPPFQISDDIVDFFMRVPQEEYESSKQIKAIGAKLGCSVSVGRTINGPRWLLRKRSKK